MLNMKKILIAGTVMTALCATAFAASNDQADKPTMKERVNRILCENRTDCPAPADCQVPRMGKHHKDFKKAEPRKACRNGKTPRRMGKDDSRTTPRSFCKNAKGTPRAS